jgi:uncharacterized glyoxalase superfamily protein PhnB
MTFQGITPYLEYEDAGAAVDWLARVFGFQERSRFVDKDGQVQQAEMLVGETELWFGGRGPGYWEKLGHRPGQYILIWVDDVDAMYERVKAAGVELDPPKDETYDVRTVRVDDPEGYHWSFMRRLGTGYIQTKSLEEGGLAEVLPS